MVTTSPALHSSQILTSDSNGYTSQPPKFSRISGEDSPPPPPLTPQRRHRSAWRTIRTVVAGDDDGVLGFELVGVHESDRVGGWETN
ncbi:hypothetical protein LOK49_LG15G01745 [Camellia lanceoleosa]|uniref:Uncharacterized protein n=1 Tax=Camellia lanceoleosa TaxID=1840588 RepID=A0ACC0F3C1_9ERIC|nr:hypothetical protein LOK49_LG15G01745 [Camellia lanceoleosa]